MKLNLRVDWIRKLKASGLEQEYKYASNDQWREIDIERIDEADLQLLLTLMDKHKDVRGSVAVKQKIDTYLKLQQNPGGTKVSRLEAIAMAIKKLMEPTPHKWLFTDNDDGYIIPWYVYDIEYEPPNPRSGAPASTEISLAALHRDKKATAKIVFHAKDLGKSAYELLKDKGYFVETPKIIEEYLKENKRYQDICGLTGEQFLATGTAFAKEDWYSSDKVAMERENQPTKVVMDDVDNEGDHERERDYGNTVITSKFWTEDKKRREDDDGANAENSVVDLPLQPYVKVFDLLKHSFCIIHVGNLTEYVYDATMIDKLILSDEKKSLVSMLVDGADVSMEDIVKGKTGGIIVIATGPPGTGKTLTAEVFSEQVKRPLYAVQCSQLGTDEEALEKELRRILSRSQRWKAILLIDEADVYVHERGDDIQQNAIVGVFLRVLEYYRGILFMTSNRETIIDDAIMSRATAWIRYDVPDREKALLIWRVLTAQYKIQLTPDQIVELVDHKPFKEISGRTIKNLLKLAKLKSLRNKEKITPEMLIYVSQFLDLEGASVRKAA